MPRELVKNVIKGKCDFLFRFFFGMAITSLFFADAPLVLVVRLRISAESL